MKTTLFAMVVTALASVSAGSWADDGGIAMSYGKPNTHEAVGKTIDLMVIWAEGEFAEHQGEGLFKRFPDEGLMIRATIDLARQLKDEAANASDGAKAQALMYAAEATARYAAQMPHLLEDRLDTAENDTD